MKFWYFGGNQPRFLFYLFHFILYFILFYFILFCFISFCPPITTETRKHMHQWWTLNVFLLWTTWLMPFSCAWCICRLSHSPLYLGARFEQKPMLMELNIPCLMKWACHSDLTKLMAEQIPCSKPTEWNTVSFVLWAWIRAFILQPLPQYISKNSINAASLKMSLS